MATQVFKLRNKDGVKVSVMRHWITRYKSDGTECRVDWTNKDGEDWAYITGDNVALFIAAVENGSLLDLDEGD